MLKSKLKSLETKGRFSLSLNNLTFTKMHSKIHLFFISKKKQNKIILLFIKTIQPKHDYVIKIKKCKIKNSGGVFDFKKVGIYFSEL
jgi:hypothetical protein